DSRSSFVKPLSLGLIGPGTIARIAHIPCIDLDPDLQLVALASSKPESAKAAGRHYRAEAYSEYCHLLAPDDIEAVIVATPPRTQEQLAGDALAAGKHLFIETPVTGDAAGARRIGERAKAAGRVAQAGFAMRSSPQIALLKARADAVRAPKLWLFE